MAKFNCSSSRPLSGGAGLREFQVQYEFPATLPDATQLPWLTIDPTTEPEKYVRALLAYGIKDNVPVDWRIEDNHTSKWCHAPWWQDKRERLRGMTSERPSQIRELHNLQTDDTFNWAVGFYNDLGCYALGQVWADPSFPKTKDFSFPEGTYSIKLLFTDANTDRVPYLAGTLEWQGAVTNSGALRTMRLLQVDVGVKDHRSPNGWFFGTFIYDAYDPGTTLWERLTPVGLSWGNDPDLTPLDYEINGKTADESWINPSVAEKFYALPRHNLGWHGRLNGPIDNPKATCVACHGRAIDWGRGLVTDAQFDDADALLPLFPADPYDKAQFDRYFRDLGTAPYVEGTQALDYSLQLAGGISRFRSWVMREYPGQVDTTTDVAKFVFDSEKPPVPDPESPPIGLPEAFTASPRALGADQSPFQR